jgi:hypothetical protein
MHPTLAKSNMFSEDSVPTTPAAQFRPAMAAFESPDDNLAFYKDGNLGDDEWDNWRLEGPAFVWYFRGFPHVHIWINVADDSSVPLNAGMGGKLMNQLAPDQK